MTFSQSPHSFLPSSLTRRLELGEIMTSSEISRQERLLSFIPEALAADADIEAGAEVYPAKDVQNC